MAVNSLLSSSGLQYCRTELSLSNLNVAELATCHWFCLLKRVATALNEPPGLPGSAALAPRYHHPRQPVSQFALLAGNLQSGLWRNLRSLSIIFTLGIPIDSDTDSDKCYPLTTSRASRSVGKWRGITEKKIYSKKKPLLSKGQVFISSALRIEWSLA